MTATHTHSIPDPLAAQHEPERLPFFCYGTLRPGHGNSRLWEGDAAARYDGEARLANHQMTAWGCPYISPLDGWTVTGTLVYANDDLSLYEYRHLLYRLDSLEGVVYADPPSGHYQRKAVDVDTPDGPVRAWVYWSDMPAKRVVPGGDWNNVERGRLT